MKFPFYSGHCVLSENIVAGTVHALEEIASVVAFTNCIYKCLLLPYKLNKIYWGVHGCCLVLQLHLLVVYNLILCHLNTFRKLKHAIIGNQRKKQHYAKLGVISQLSHILTDQQLTDNTLLTESITTLGSFAHGQCHPFSHCTTQ